MSDTIDLRQAGTEAEQVVRKAVLDKLPQVAMRIVDGEVLNDEDREAMISVSRAAVAEMLQGGAGADA